MQKVIQLSGLDCAHCAAELEEKIAKIPGVQYASVGFVNQKLTVECDDEQTLEKVLFTASHFEEVQVGEEKENMPKEGGRYALNEAMHAKQWLWIACSTLFFIGAFILEKCTNGLPFFILSCVWAQKFSDGLI